MGGIVDPNTGEVVWSFHVPIADQAQEYARNPPSVLDALRITPIDLPAHPFDGHGEPVNVAFAIACPCGSKRFTPLGYWSADEDRFVSPITLECAACDQWYDFFDVVRHGFDGAVGNNRGLEPPPDETFDAIAEESEIIVRFEFPSDHLGAPDLPAAASELFSWITIVGRNPETGALATLFDDECA